MRLADFQREVFEWTKHNFDVDGPSVHPLLGMVEELGELCHAVLKSKQKIRLSEEDARKEIIDAVGDLFIFTADYCARENIDLEHAVVSTWDKVKQRDWIKFPKNGVSD